MCLLQRYGSNPEIPLLEIHLKQVIMEVDKGFVLFFFHRISVCHSIIFKNWKLSKCPATEKWIIYDVCIHKAAKYIAFKINAGEEYWMTWKAVSTV